MRTLTLLLLSLCVLAAAFVCVEAVWKCPKPGFKPFECPPQPPSPSEPQDVNRLRPADVKAVIALGDSITAGFGMISVDPLEFRGWVYSTGGEEGALTIGNYLRVYNPKLQGQCRGTTVPLTKLGKGLNVAVSEAKVRDLDGQITRLVQLLDTDYANVKNEWKLMTLWIGANNVCDACEDGNSNGDPVLFEKTLRAALTRIYYEVPKVRVQLMTIFNISGVWDLAMKSKDLCEILVPKLHECGCLVKNDTLRNLMDARTPLFNNAQYKVAAEFQAMNYQNFTVVVQPGVQGMPFGNFDEHYLSDVDCFHPSLCADQAFSVQIWNNMFQAAGKKDDGSTVNPDQPAPFYCPGPNDYLQ